LGSASFMHRPYRSLSQGEKQKVLIGRALINCPQLLVLAAPATGFDLFVREQMLKTVEVQNTHELTILYETHHTEEILPAFNQVMLMRAGSVYGTGTREEMLTETILSDFHAYPVTVSWRDERAWLKLKS